MSWHRWGEGGGRALWALPSMITRPAAAFVLPTPVRGTSLCGGAFVRAASAHHVASVPRRRARVSASSASFSDRVVFTPMDNNTFTLTFGAVKLLIDPWLTGDLIFGSPSFYQMRKPTPSSAATDPSRLDLSTVSAVVLTQGLADHAHPPTLRTLPRNLPIFAATDALPLLSDLSFCNVVELLPGQTVLPFPSLPISITPANGSLVGPPWSRPQLAVLFSFHTPDKSTLRIYHEPHCNHDPAFLRQWKGKVDAAIVPVASTFLPILNNYSLVNGVPEAVDLCKQLQPRVCVGFDNSRGEVVDGVLTRFLRRSGGFQELRDALAQQGLTLPLLGEIPTMADLVIAGKGVPTTGTLV